MHGSFGSGRAAKGSACDTERQGGCHRGEIASRTAERRRCFRVARVGAGTPRSGGTVCGMGRGLRPPGPARVPRHDSAVPPFRLLRKELPVLPVLPCRSEKRRSLRALQRFARSEPGASARIDRPAPRLQRLLGRRHAHGFAHGGFAARRADVSRVSRSFGRVHV